MICFTELEPEETESHQAKYGKFGVGVSKEWLVKNNAKKVKYVEIPGKTYHGYVEKLKSYAPKSIRGVPIENLLSNPDSRFEVTQTLSGSFMSEGDQKANIAYLELLEKLAWTQIHQDIADLEWRIRNPRPYRFKGNPTRKQQIDLGS